MGELENFQRLIWAITHKNPSNNFYAVTAEDKKNKRVTDR